MFQFYNFHAIQDHRMFVDISIFEFDENLSMYGFFCSSNYIPHFRNPAIWLVEIGVVILAIPVKKRKMPKPVNSLLKKAGHFSKDYWYWPFLAF